MSEGPAGTVDANGIAAVTAFLESHGVRHEVVEHRPTFSAAAEARASGTEPREAAKTLALHDHDGYRMAVIPATHRLDLHRAREVLGASSHLRLATEAELEQDFPTFDVGAMPPLGPMMPMPEVIDVHLLYHERILCAGGDHRHCAVGRSAGPASGVRAAGGGDLRDARGAEPLPGSAEGLAARR